MRPGLVLLSAALYVLAFPPWDAHFLIWIALLPFFAIIRRVGPARAFGLGLLWGTAAIWGIGHWVPTALMNYWAQPLWFGITFAMIGAVVFVGSYGAGFAVCASWLSHRCEGVPRAFLLASLWVSWEVARGTLLTGDPWLLAGYALGPLPILIQAADLGGVFLLSFVVALVNASVAELLEPGRPMRALVPAAFAVLALLGYGGWRLHVPLPAEPRHRVSVVQGNNDLGSQWNAEHYGRGLDEYLRLSSEAGRDRPEVLIWPESAVTFFVAHEPEYRARIAALLKRTGADLLVGAPHYEDFDPARPEYFNSAFYMTGGAEITGRYDKIHLMPFGEYFPLRTIEFLRRRFERVRYFTPGSEARLLETRLGRVAVVICFEAIFPDLVRRRMAEGADLLVNLSNDAWLGSNAGPRQHATMVPLRAVENRTWVVRATTTGVSALIDPFGRTVAGSGLGVPAVLHGTVVPLRVDTPYKRYGDLFAFACILCSALAFPVLARARRQRRGHGRAG